LKKIKEATPKNFRILPLPTINFVLAPGDSSSLLRPGEITQRGYPDFRESGCRIPGYQDIGKKMIGSWADALTL
jgi:hypothetical protein